MVHAKKKARTCRHADIQLLCWTPGDQQLPQTLHVPYWARKPNHNIKCLTMVEKMLQTVEGAALREVQAMEAINAVEDRKNNQGLRPQGGGGWMNKCVTIMSLLFDGHTDEACSVSGDFLKANQTAYNLVWRTPIVFQASCAKLIYCSLP